MLTATCNKWCKKSVTKAVSLCHHHHHHHHPEAIHLAPSSWWTCSWTESWWRTTGTRMSSTRSARSSASWKTASCCSSSRLLPAKSVRSFCPSSTTSSRGWRIRLILNTPNCWLSSSSGPVLSQLWSHEPTFALCYQSCDFHLHLPSPA